MSNIKKLKFEDCIEIIDQEIKKRRAKWTLGAVQWIDYDDIAQILRLHIYKKWFMWDQARPLRPWLNRIFTNQLSNLIRNLYGNSTRPCLKNCPANEGGNLCRIFVTQCSSCPLYDHWVRTKKNAHDIRLPLALENHSNEILEPIDKSVDIEKGSKNLQVKLKEVLKPVEYRVYKYLYVENKSEEEVGRLLGFKTSEAGRHLGYRQIHNIKESIIKKANKLVYGGEIDF